MPARRATVTRVWPDTPDIREHVARARDDIVTEQQREPELSAEAPSPEPHDGTAQELDAVWEQAAGPFRHYERHVVRDDGQLVETTRYRLSVPWFGWLFSVLVRRRFRHLHHRQRNPWWSPPDRLDHRQVLVLALAAALSMSSAFVNTLFTQTVRFAGDEFGIGNSGVGIAGSIVRVGILLTLPTAMIADRIGRRRVVVAVAWAAPLTTALGAVAPTFPLLVATQTIGRPLGLALDFLVAVVVAEEMPRNSRAYAVSLMAMAAGLGAGIAVMSLPLADIGETSWRLIYLVTLVWLLVALDATRRLPETVRFTVTHAISPRFDRRRFAVIGAVILFANVFVSPASLFRNSFLEDERGYSGALIAAFILATNTPAAIGLIIGGRAADVRGRRRLLAIALPVGTLFMVVGFAVVGPWMWLSMFLGGFIGAIAAPALAVYRTELFPTGNRGKASGLLTATALIGGIGGLLAAGALLDAGWEYAEVMGLLALSQVIVVAIVLTSFIETAHHTLEELNPEDQLDQTGIGPPSAPGPPLPS